MIAKMYDVLRRHKGKNEYLLIYRMIKLFLIVFYPCIAWFGRKRRKEEVANVILSLTTFPARIGKVHVTIETLLRQTRSPEKIILWLAESQFPDRKIPRALKRQQKRGLEIHYCDDLRSHKKYYYAMKKYPDKMIITVDDDTYYPENLVEQLLVTHEKFPDCVCCMLAHGIVLKEGEVEPYASWRADADEIREASHLLMPVGCEGVLYPPHSLDERVFSREDIAQLCPRADDLWLKAMATLAGTKTVQCNAVSVTFANQMIAGKESLNSVNVAQGENDRQLRNILGKYPEVLRRWRGETANA